MEPQDLIARTDRVLKDLEDAEIERLNAALDAAYLQLEKQLLVKYPQYTAEAKPNLLGTQRGVLLASELKDQLILLNPGREREIRERYEKLLTTASQEGVTLGDELIRLQGGDDFVTATANVPIEAVAVMAQEAVKRLKNHDDKFRDEASVILTQGLIQGMGAQRVAGSLRQRLGITKGKAEAIARTEIINAQDTATRNTYKANNIDFVQRVATQDSRVCQYCAARAGKVYPVDEAPAVIHPHDRCYNMPWLPEWEESGQTEDEWVKKHAEEVQKIVADRGEQLDEGRSPFEKAAGAPSPIPVWSPKDGWIDKSVQQRGENRSTALLAAALLLGGTTGRPGLVAIPIPISAPSQEQEKENQLFKALVVGAALVGASVGSYYLARARYRAGFKRSARMAEDLIAEIDLTDPGDNEQITFVAGGFAGMGGDAGLEYAPAFGEFLLGHHMVGSPTPATDQAKPIGEDPLGHVSQNWGGLVARAIGEGYNPDSVRMAAQAAAYHRKYGKPVNLIGYSAGGFVTSEAHEILKVMGVPVKTATIGSAWFGFTDLSPDEHIGLMGKGDVFAGLPVQNRVQIDDVESHWLDKYGKSEVFWTELQNWFGTSEVKRQPRRTDSDPPELSSTIVDLYGKSLLTGLSEAEKKALPERVQKLLKAKQETAIVKAEPTAIQLAEARGELAKLETAIELGPVDLGQARLESLSLLGDQELAGLPESIRKQIQGARVQLLPGAAPPKALPGYQEIFPAVAEQLKSLMRGQLPNIDDLSPQLLALPIAPTVQQQLAQRTTRELYQQARSQERGLSRLAGFRLRQKLVEIGKSGLPPFAKLSQYRQAVLEELGAIATAPGPKQPPGTEQAEQLTRFTFDGIQFYTPELKANSPTLDIVRKLAELNLPDEVLQAIGAIYISKQPNAAEQYWRKKLKLTTAQVPASINLEDASITTYRGKAKVEDLLRQAGYLVAYRKFGQLEPPEGSDFKRAIAEGKPITPYGFNSPAADFADSVAQFLTDPDRLKKFNPQRYEALARLLNYRHPVKPVEPVPAGTDSRSPEIVDSLRQRNAELTQQITEQRQTAEAIANKQRSTNKVKTELAKVDDAKLTAQSQNALSQVRVQEEALDRLSQQVLDVEARAAQILNPFNKPYFSEVPGQVGKLKQQLKTVENQLTGLARIGSTADRVRTNIQKLEGILSDLSTRKESLKVFGEGRQVQSAIDQVKQSVVDAEQELIGLPKTPERSQALRDLQRIKAAVNIQQGGISVADLHRQALQPRINQLKQLSDELEGMRSRVEDSQTRLQNLQQRLNRLPQKTADLLSNTLAQYNVIKRTRQAQGKIPQRVENYRTVRQQYSEQLARRQQEQQAIADNYQTERQAAINNTQAFAEQRFQTVRDNIQILTALRPGSVAWLVDRKNWESDMPSDLALVLANAPGKTRQEKLEALSQEVSGQIAQTLNAIAAIEQRLDYPGQAAQQKLNQVQTLLNYWQQNREALTADGTLTDAQLKKLLAKPDQVQAIDLFRYGNQLGNDLEAFNQDFVQVLLAQPDVDPKLIIDQSELYRRAKERFLEETGQTRAYVASELEQGLQVAQALQQRIVKDQQQPLVLEINGKAVTSEQVRAELAEAKKAIQDLLKLKQVDVQSRQAPADVPRIARRQQEETGFQARQQRFEDLKAELSQVNLEIQKRREAAARGQKRGIATDRLEAQQRRILKDIEKLAQQNNGETDPGTN